MTTPTEKDAAKAVAEKKLAIYKDVVPLTAGMFADNTKISKEKMIATLHRSILGLTKSGELRPINDLKLFMAISSQYGLNPFKKEIYATYVWDSSRGREELVPIVAIHGLRKLARQGGVYTHTGSAAIEYDKSDEKKLVSATVTVFGQWKKGETPVEVTSYTAMYNEFVRTKKDGSVTKMWSEKPQLMLIKCAEANAIRQGFDISGIYIEEEIAPTNVIDVDAENDNA
jgi:phage recombination protein Bet